MSSHRKNCLIKQFWLLQLIEMEVLSPKQRLILAGMKCNSLPKIAKVNVEVHEIGNDSLTRSESMANKNLVTSSLSASAKSERVHRAHSLYTIAATGSNEYRSNALVNLLTSPSRNTPVEYDIFDPSEEDVPPTPSISVSQLATGPGSKSSWRIGMVVVGVLLTFIVLTVIILTIYFVKREEFGSTEQLVGYELTVMNRNKV
ncbi:hypothetical protein TcWFU_007653 [Taenia crassiceps]|uniref:Uncharacterized protein n=1 Tax=Taenia crassiceps TaxID=6207 RepID=A0ABR4Q9Q1_9CEST